MVRALLIGFAISVVLAIGTRLLARWRFGLGRQVHRLRPHGAAEYGAYLLLMLATVLVTAAQRTEGSLSGSLWAVAVPVFLVAACLAFFVFLTHTFWTSEGIGSWDPLRRQRFLRWADVRTVQPVPLGLGTTVSDGRLRIGFGRWQSGVEELERFLQSRGLLRPGSP